MVFYYRHNFVDNFKVLFMILGLTGAFGGGKSTVLEYFKKQSWHTFDADRACHDLYDSGAEELLAKVRELFGEQAVTAENRIDRSVIAQSAFANPEKMKALTAMLYPLMEKQMQSEIDLCRKDGIHGIFEVPLLFESHYEHFFDAVLTLWTDPELRKIRLRNRNYTQEEMKKRDSRQLDPALKLEYADFAVINNGSLEMLHLQLNELVRQIENKDLK